MIKMRIGVVMLVVFLWCANAYPLDWIKLHEQADATTLESALSLVASDPAALDNQYVLGLVYLSMHKDKEAQDVFAGMLGIQPQLIEARWGFAETLRRQHRTAQSVQILQEIIAGNPDFAPALLSLAYIRYFELKFTETVQLTATVIRLGRERVDTSNFSRAYLLFAGAKGMIAHFGGPLAKAAHGTQVFPNLKRAEKLRPNSAAVHFGLGAFYLLAPSIVGGNIDRAEEYLKETVTIDPLLGDAYVRLAQVYKVKGDQARYEMYLTRALQLDPQSELALDIKNNTCHFICVGK